MTEELPPLPAFLDRKKWTPDMWKKSAERQKEAQARIQEELDALREKALMAKEAKKVKEAKDAERRKERLEVEERREAKRVLRRAALAALRRAFDAKGQQTANSLRQTVAEQYKDLVPWALRTMLKEQEITKVSRQTYTRRGK